METDKADDIEMKKKRARIENFQKYGNVEFFGEGQLGFTSCPNNEAIVQKMYPNVAFHESLKRRFKRFFKIDKFFVSRSETFSYFIFLGPNKEDKWIIHYTADADMTYKVNLRCQYFAFIPQWVYYRFSLLDNDGKELTTQEYRVDKDFLQSSIHVAEFINADGDFGLLRSRSAVEDFNFSIEVYYYVERKLEPKEEKMDFFESPSLKDDLSSLLISQKFTDVTLVVGSTEFPAHKAILSARSSVFEAMFTHEMKESVTNRVVIDECKPEDMKNILEFMYAGEVSDLDKKALGLLPLADKYGFEELRVACGKSLESSICASSAIETFLLAGLYSAKNLREKAACFISRNLGQIMKTDAWKKNISGNAQLLEEILILTTK